MGTIGPLWRQASPPHFLKLPADNSGIDFENRIAENAQLNIFSFQYLYNGAGVGLGDINNDGVPDLYFVGNQVPNKLYLNQGNLKFEDITQSAKAVGAATGWTTGVSMVDINADGWLDIHLSRGGLYCMAEKNLANLLLVNIW